MRKIIAFLTLFTSASTLVCCAIPALLVSIGMGAALVGMISSFPQLVWLSENKVIVFGLGAFMLLLAGYMQRKEQNEPCPIDPDLAEACKHTRKWSKRIYICSVMIYLVGAFFAFLLPLLMGSK